ncbi:hypothetical protein DHD05_01420 [Arenibacter sp. N53]|uniref:ComEC/Rec2 family competence protein n=1 Tax=Arenibacter TaxID=178469 RepID=UPI000CD4450D|nr:MULTISPECIES: MBL fold metallo-hydrolase [Arenibacter]MCM4150236.1 hypothetical protein [Arenibacter sp. N53]
MKIKLICSLLLLTLLNSCEDIDDITPILNITSFPNRVQDFSLWQLDGLDQVQMAYIIRTDDNNIIVVDGGLPEFDNFLIQHLKQFGGKVDTWIITHPHIDHAGALLRIIPDNQVKIKKILHVALEEDWVKVNEEKALDFYKHYSAIINSSNIPLVNVRNNDMFEIGNGVTMNVFGAINDKITVNAINNSSMVFKIESKSKSVLFLGDLGVEGGNVILNGQNVNKIQANYVQMAHHGQDGVDQKFYQKVSPHYAIWPTPIWLWDNNLDNKGLNSGNWKTLIVREWISYLQVKKNYVAGIDGTVQID